MIANYFWLLRLLVKMLTTSPDGINEYDAKLPTNRTMSKLFHRYTPFDLPERTLEDYQALKYGEKLSFRSFKVLERPNGI